MVATTGEPPVFIAVNDGILFPEPLDANPMVLLLLVQLYTMEPTPGGGLLKFTVVVGELLHTTWLAMAFTVTDGLTVILNVLKSTKLTGEPLSDTFTVTW